MPQRTPNEQQPHVDLKVVDRVRAICMGLLGTFEQEAWGDPSFRVHGRMYAIIKFGHGSTTLWLAAPEGAQEMLVAHPERFSVPSRHPLHAGWVAVRLDAAAGVDWDELAFLLEQARHHVASRSSRSRPSVAE